MNLNKHIENLKTKPDHIKKRVAFLISFSFSFMVFTGWIVSSYGISSSPTLANNTENSDANATLVEAPVSSLTASAVNAWTDIKKIIFGSSNTNASSNNLEIKGGSR